MNERNNISPLSFLKSLAPQERFSASIATYLLLLVASPVTGICADYYAAPTGTASAPGTKSNPWDLATALSNRGVVAAGDTVWLRGGTYKGVFTSNLVGSASAPVVVRQYTGERAIIDGSPSSSPPLTVYGSYVWFWGIEVMNSDPLRVSAQTGSAPTDLRRGIGLWIEAPHSKFINMVVHDTSEGIGFWTPASDSEIYGSIIYSNGWDAPDRGHGHGIYTQNQSGTKRMTDNIIFNQFSHGVHAYTEGGNIDNITVEGNILFNNGLLSAVTGNIRNILIGGGQVAHNPSVLSNYTYYNPGGNNILGYGVGCQNLTATGNYFAGATALTLGPCPGSTITSNTFYGATSGLSGFPSNTFLTSRPTGVNVFIRPNRYEPGRANIAVFNWSLQNAVGIDPSGILAVGDSYEIRDVQNYYGAPVLKDTYNGGLIQLPTGSTAITPPIGNAPVIPRHTSPEFGSYVLLRTSATTPGGNQPPVVNAGAAQTITLPSSATLTGVATDDGLPSNTLTSTWKVVSGPGTVVFGNANALVTTASFSAPGAYTLSLTASDGALSSSSNVIVTVNASQGGGSSTFRLNAGGSTYTDTTGNVWSGDTYFNGGSTYSTAASINKTSDPRLYQTVRYGAFSYVIPVANGAATVNLKFAEPYFTSAGQRVFNVSINGQTVLANFDVIAQAGSANASLDRKFTTNVTNGQLTIQFTPVVDQALVNAIEILPSSTGTVGVTVSPTTVNLAAGQTAAFTAALTGTSNGAVSWSVAAGPGTITTAGLYTAPATITTPTTATIVAKSIASPSASATATVNLGQFAGIYVNSGGANVSSAGVTWGADTGFTGGYLYTNPSSVAGTTIPALYQTLRYGSTFSYQFAVPNGVRTVKLRFAETFFTQRGSRVFNVAINGQNVLSNFDIVAAGGAAQTATDRQFNVTVVDGKLKIDFTSIANYALVNAIDIL